MRAWFNLQDKAPWSGGAVSECMVIAEAAAAAAVASISRTTAFRALRRRRCKGVEAAPPMPPLRDSTLKLMGLPEDEFSDVGLGAERDG